ncbi:hypothetical protein SAMIE_1024080 [Sphingobium amiense]|uniref:Uncharacterized protein n=1 Tax=Sphingobium amiense TaxID=135719 RepID=A0A494W8K1_9SPHN|nr:hypothetical protein [Sphingobium amiense]BBD98907.1 hypothetical protein SAMIE_1024080 [Sphingobium amiense]
MDEFRSRTEIAPVDRSVVRAAAPAPAVKPVTASQGADGPAARARRAPSEVAAKPLDDDLASVAEFVEVHARVSAILSDLDAGSLDVEDATSQLVPKPIVIVPLPPASREAVEHAETVAKRIVERASYAHSAHAQISRGTVEHIASQ